MLDPSLDRVLFSEAEIRARLAELGEAVSRDYAGRDLVLIGVLKGAALFLADLTRAVRVPHAFDFVAASSYGPATESSGRVTVEREARLDLEGRHVLLVEDIYDTGCTLAALVERFRRRHRPASLAVCAFLWKKRPRRTEVPIAYVGFEIEDVFAVGYGLDHNERFRNLPYVAVLAPGAAEDANAE